MRRRGAGGRGGTTNAPCVSQALATSQAALLSGSQRPGLCPRSPLPATLLPRSAPLHASPPRCPDSLSRLSSCRFGTIRPQLAVFLAGLILGWCSGSVVTSLARDSLGKISPSLAFTGVDASGRHAWDIEIVTSHFKEDLSWLNASRVPVIICDKAGADPLPRGMYADIPCSLHRNLGKEASSYLAYIVSRYESLPARVAFLHGHENTIHQRHPAKSILRAIEMARPELGYVPLNNDWHVLADTVHDIPSGSPPETTLTFADTKHWNLARVVWAKVIQPITHTAMPKYVRNDRAAQFVVRSENIRQHPKELYEALLRVVVYHEGFESWDDRRGAVALEIAWPLLFEGSNDICASLPKCTHEEALKKYFDEDKTFLHIIDTA